MHLEFKSPSRGPGFRISYFDSTPTNSTASSACHIETLTFPSLALKLPHLVCVLIFLSSFQMCNMSSFYQVEALIFASIST